MNKEDGDLMRIFKQFKWPILIVLLVVLVAVFYVEYDKYQEEKKERIVYEGVHQGIAFEFEVGCMFADLYEDLLKCETTAESQKFLREKLPNYIDLIQNKKSIYRKSDSLNYYLSGDLEVHLQVWEQKCDTMRKLDFNEQRLNFLQQYAEQYKWGIACRYYQEHVNVDQYFSDQSVLQERVDWYLIYNFCNNDMEKWRIWRQEIAEEYDDKLLVLAEEKNTAYEEALENWRQSKANLMPEEYEAFFKSEQTRQLMQLCEESIQADIDSLVYWRVNNWVNNQLANPDYKVYFMQNYAHDFGIYDFLNV